MTFENVKKDDIISYVYNNDIDGVCVDTMKIEEVKTRGSNIIIKTVVLDTTNPDFTLIGHHDIFNIPFDFKNSTEFNNILLSIDNNDIRLKGEKLMSKSFIVANKYYRQNYG